MACAIAVCLMPSEQDQDGHLLSYELAPPTGRPQRLIHVNGMASSTQKQLRDLETFVWLTVEHPFDITGVHNSTAGFKGDILESLLGKAELVRLRPEHQTTTTRQRLQGYAELLTTLCEQELAADTDILAAAQGQTQTLAKATTNQPLGLDPDLWRRLPFLRSMDWQDLDAYLYGNYPAGAPRPTLRLAYELVQALRAKAEVFVVAHSQGTIIATLAFHILQHFYGSDQWSESVRFIGYGPVILFDDLPVNLRSQAVLIQHRQDLVAEAFSNLRNVDLWRNLQTQLKALMERAQDILELANQQSHHSANFYLGLVGQGDRRAAQLMQQLLMENWQTHPLIQTLRASRVILEDLASSSSLVT